VNHQERKVLFKRGELEKNIERRYRPGKKNLSGVATN